MNKAPRKSFLLLGVILILFMLSCNLIPQGIQAIFSSPTPTSTNTPTPTPTRTSTPTFTPTPVPPILFYGCPFPSDCPEAERLASYTDAALQSNEPIYVEFPYNVPVRVNLGWYTLDQAHLDENMRHIEFFFKIDGVRYDDPSMFKYGIYYDEEGNPTDYPGYFFGVVLLDWNIGIQHTIEYGFVIDSSINDGWGDYDPQTVTFTIVAMPVRQPTATPTATFKPRPTAVPATPTSSCPVDSTIVIDNTTGGQVTLYLSGPASYVFYIPSGTMTLNVCSGGYSYTAYGCGGASDTGSIHSGEEHEFYCVTY